MTDAGKVQGAIGWLREHQPHNLNAMIVCDRVEELEMALILKTTDQRRLHKVGADDALDRAAEPLRLAAEKMRARRDAKRWTSSDMADLLNVLECDILKLKEPTADGP
jgi:hypothetical protein